MDAAESTHKAFRDGVTMDEERDLIVMGGGEPARVFIEAARSRPDLWKLLGFTDPNPREDTFERLGIVNLGGDEGYSLFRFTSWFVLGVGGVGVSAVRR